MKISARNQLKGKVVRIEDGTVNGIVVLNVSGIEISATISMSAIRELGLASGKDAYAIIKSTSVMVAVD